MENNLKKNNNSVEKLKLTRKSKINLGIDISLATLFFIFLTMNIFMYSRMEYIEQKLYKIKNHNFFSLIIIDDFNLLKKFKKVSYIVFDILAGIEFLVLYINIIYLFFHPFIGLKLIFVVNLSHFGIILLKIIIQSYRPFWKFKTDKFVEETECKTDYASPSLPLFFFCFFYLYSILSFQKMKKNNFKMIYRIILFFIHFLLTFSVIIILGEILDEYFHQLIFTTILGYILICILLAKDKNIHNFIFQSLKNIYNARKNKIKIFFYITGLLIITLISTYFIDEYNISSIKQKLKKCKEKKLFGMKESLKDLGYIFGIIGAVWGASFTLERNISKWWGKNSNCILIIKFIIMLIFNGLFITLKFFLPKLISDIELNFVLSMLINYLQNYFTFGIIPLIFNKFGLISKDKKINLFKKSIFKEEKDDYGFIDLDIEQKKEIENKDEKKSNEETNNIKNNLIENNKYQKNKQENEEIYGNSNLVENVQNLEEEEEYLYLEGIDEPNNNEINK